MVMSSKGNGDKNITVKPKVSEKAENALSSSHCEDGFFCMCKSLPNGIFAVSLFGLFLGMSTTMVYSQLGMFLKTELHATEATIALIDGVVEFFSFISRIFAGIISDYMSERKLILFLGCIVTLLARPIFAIATSPLMVIITNSIERIGNGFQATPRDALIADLSKTEDRGKSYGFSRSLKTVGSFLGTPIAILIMYLSCDNYRTVFLWATLPVVLSIFFLLKVETPKEIKAAPERQAVRISNPFQKKYLKSLDAVFWKILALAFLFELGHFCESLLPIYASYFLSKTTSGSVSMFISVGQVLCSFPIGLYADKFGKGVFIRGCMIMMVFANVFFIFANSVAYVYIGAFLWGGQMTAIQGLFLSIISSKVDVHLRATAIGIYYCTLGVAYLIASSIAGNIWTNFGCKYAFMYSLFFSCFALTVFRLLLPKKYEH
jgi:MFS family permease